MATGLEANAEPEQATPPPPGLKITRLHIKGLKSIASLNLPEDGLGWSGEIPDFVMIAGINGSGKTTLLEFLASVFEQVVPHARQREEGIHEVLLEPPFQLEEARLDFTFESGHSPSLLSQFLIGDSEYIRANIKENFYFGYMHTESKKMNRASPCGQSNPAIRDAAGYYPPYKLVGYQPPETATHVLYFPSERRTLLSPPTDYKSVGNAKDPAKFVHRWQPPEKWDSSLEAKLYAVRWEDLNAKEEGRPEDATGFAAYSRAFERFFEGRKRLFWRRGELVVETKNGVTHDLNGLSSGEKQVVLFAGELLHRWGPGSLILIDEPELHLHETYQTRLWEMLVEWQKERGGQVIVTTQSAQMFRLAETGTRVVLGGQMI